MNKKTRDDAIEALLLEANSTNSDDYYRDLCNTYMAQDLAEAAWWAVLDTSERGISTHEEDCLEAAQLLLEGWNPGQKVVKL